MNIDNEIFSTREEQARQLGINPDEYESLECLENAIASKLEEGMEPLSNIIQLIDELNCEL